MRGKPESCDAMEANRSQSLGEKSVNCVECQRQVESNHNRTLTWQSTGQCCLEKKKWLQWSDGVESPNEEGSKSEWNMGS